MTSMVNAQNEEIVVISYEHFKQANFVAKPLVCHGTLRDG